jgi:hypothetical protein
MIHPLQRRLARVRQRARMLYLLWGAGWALSSTAVLLVLLGILDYLLRYEDRGLRLLHTAVALLGCAAAAAWFVLRVVRRRFSGLDVAQHLERHYPSLGGRLASAYEFLHARDDDPLAGSAPLRRAVIEQAESELAQLDLSRALDARPAIGSAAAALAALALGAALCAAAPQSALAALVRMVQPWSEHRFPQRHHLHIEPAAARIARGEVLEIRVGDRFGYPLPDEVRLHLRWLQQPDEPLDSGTPADDVVPMQRSVDRMVHRTPPLERSLAFRAEGGDDDSLPWTVVEVVEPPRLARLQRIVHPPEYVLWPAEAVGANFRALAGSRLEVRAVADRPLRSAVLLTDDGLELPAWLPGAPPVGSGGALLLHKSQRCWLRLTDHEGLTATVHVADFQVLDDAPPQAAFAGEVLLLEPWRSAAIDLGTLGAPPGTTMRPTAFALPSLRLEQPPESLTLRSGAVVPLQLTVNDDVQLQEVKLVVVRSQQPEVPWEIPIPWQGRRPPHAPGLAALGHLEALRLAFDWKLDAAQVAPGSTLSVAVAARDGREQWATSPRRTLRVLDAEPFSQYLANEQSLLLSDYRALLDETQQAASRAQQLAVLYRGQQVDDGGGTPSPPQGAAGEVFRGAAGGEDLGLRLVALRADEQPDAVPSPGFSAAGEAGSPSPAEAGRLLWDSLRETHRRLQAGLVDRDRGPAGRLVRLLLELQCSNSRGEDRESAQRLVRVFDVALAADALHLQPLGELLRAESPDAQRVAQCIVHLEGAITALQLIVAELRHFDDFRHVVREIHAIQQRHEQLRLQSAELEVQTRSRFLEELPADLVQRLAALRRQHVDLALEVDALLVRMADLAAQLQAAQPRTAGTLADALHVAQGTREATLTGELRAAAGEVARNALHLAAQRHQRVDAMLQEMLGILAQRPLRDPQALVAALRQAESEAARLRETQQHLHDSWQALQRGAATPEAASALAAAGQQQHDLAAEAGRLARELHRLSAAAASLSLEEAVRHMQSAAAAAQPSRAADSAGELPMARASVPAAAGQAAVHAGASLSALDEALQHLAVQRQQLESQLAQQTLAAAIDRLTALREAQQQLADETAQLRDRVPQHESPTPVQRAVLQELGRQQADVAAQTAHLRGRLEGTTAFSLALDSASAHMRAAAERLQQPAVGDEVTQAQHAALRRLEQLIVAVMSAAEGMAGGGVGADAASQPASSGAASPLEQAELKMLELWQAELLERTRRLHAAMAGREPAPEERQQLLRLADEQGRLAALLLRLTRKAAAPRGPAIPPPTRDPRPDEGPQPP